MSQTAMTAATNIVVPADGSPAAEAAAWYAGAVADARGGRVHVVAAWDPAAPAGTDPGQRFARPADLAAVLEEIRAALDAAGLAVAGHVRRCGLVAALCAVASEHDAELIVVPAGWRMLAHELRWRAACRVDMLVVDSGLHPGFRPFPIAAAR
jgi:nucleotide-binding universal stress UspA family protein